MPGMDGFEVAETITGYSKTKDLSIIFLSAVNTDKRFIQKGYASGGVDYITKPVDPDILLLKVKTFYKLFEQTQELTRMQQSLREEIEFRKRAEEKKDEFMTIASHELKTPVTSLTGYLQILERSMDEADRNKGFIKKALDQTKKLTSLISDLLDVSKIETGKLPLSFSHFDIVMLIREIVELMQYSSKTHRIVQEIDVPELKVWADRQRIEQVLINLLSNAIKYSPNANLVTISMKQKNRYVQVSVCDNGIGIGKDQQERIFSRFYRVDDLASHISGLGIGLYISKDIIVRHGGTLTVESEPGKGSEFSFKIPIDEENRTMPFSA